MNKREIQIKNEIVHNKKYKNGLGAFGDVFMQGAKWADENPDDFTLKAFEIVKIVIKINEYEKILKKSSNSEIQQELENLKVKLDACIIDFNNQKLHTKRNI